MGLAGTSPPPWISTVFPVLLRRRRARNALLLAQGRHELDFPRYSGMRFHNGNLPLHENGMQTHAYNGDEVVYSKVIIPSAVV
ncbi:serine dehydratase beta chain [Shigella flexneri]